MPRSTSAGPGPASTRLEALVPFLRVVVVVGLLYAFLVGVAFLEAGIAGLGEGFRDLLLREISRPIAGLFTGVVLTVAVQSSSVSTSTIVGLVGAGTISVELAVPMIMGANIGTTITNTLVSLGHLRRPDEFRHAFAAATMHDFFNVFTVALLLPLELATGALSRTAAALTEFLTGRTVGFEPGTSPIRAAVKLPVGRLEDVLAASTLGARTVAALLIVLALATILTTLTTITRTMRRMVAGSVERAMNRVVGTGGGAVGIVIGMLVTVAVQSSSITTSILVPLAAGGILAVRNAFPITLGANVGTTITALIASLAVARPEGLTVALVHTLFNVAGIAIFYPLPALRELPVRAAEALAAVAVRRRTAVVVYIIGLFVVVPIVGIILFD